MQDLVSVIIPNYNHAPYLRQRIESVLHQDYSMLEIILLDDCSQDDSILIMNEYANDHRIRAIVPNEKNSGSTFIQWKKGIAMARGKYIWIAESDDMASPTFLSSLVAAMQQAEQKTGAEPVLTFCASQWIDAEGKPIENHVYQHWTKNFTMDGDTFVRHYLLGYCFICNASAVLMRKDAAMNVSDRCANYKSSGDRQFWIEMAEQGDVCFHAQKLNFFRQHSHKVSNSAACRGQNMLEDYAIYTEYCSKHTLSLWDKWQICGYHQRAARAKEIDEKGQHDIRNTWGQEKEWNKWAECVYWLNRIKLYCER